MVLTLKALITGASGFVGGYLIDCLCENEIEIFVTKLPHEKIDSQNISENNIFNLNILDKSEVRNVLLNSTPDYIFHLAAQSSVAQSWKNPTFTMEVNLIGTVNLLDTIRELKINPRILLIGSGEEYGYIKQNEVPINEENCLRPGNPYAVSKAAQSMIGQVYSRAYDMDIIMMKAFNHIGPKQNAVFVVADFCKQIAEIEKGLREPVIKVGNLEAKRDFTDVRDIVRGYLTVMQKGKKGETYNIGTGKAISIQEILDKLLAMSTKDIEIYQDENKIRPTDIPVIEANINKIKRDTGWYPKIDLDKTLSDTLNYWRSMIG